MGVLGPPSCFETRTKTMKMTHPYGQRMKYPYSMLGKLVEFPWKWSWHNGRFMRYYTYALIGSVPLFYLLTRLSTPLLTLPHGRPSALPVSMIHSLPRVTITREFQTDISVNACIHAT